MQRVKKAILALATILALTGAAHAEVVVTQGKKGLTITGDDGHYKVDIEGLGATGAVSVYVDDFPVDDFFGITDIKVKLGAGDDALFVAGIHIGGTLAVDMGAGNDELDLDVTTNLTDFAPDHDVFIGGGVTVKLGGQPGDWVDWIAEGGLGITIGGDVTISQAADLVMDGDGGTFRAEETDIHIGGDLKISKHVGMDVNGDTWTAQIDDLNVGGSTTLQLGKAPNAVEIADSTFVGSVGIAFGSGDDLLDLELENHGSLFHGLVTAQGGQGNDEVYFDFNQFLSASAPSFTGFE
jgi:hypothetical protein